MKIERLTPREAESINGIYQSMRRDEFFVYLTNNEYINAKNLQEPSKKSDWLILRQGRQVNTMRSSDQQF